MHSDLSDQCFKCRGKKRARLKKKTKTKNQNKKTPKDKERVYILSGYYTSHKKKKSPKPAVWYFRWVIKQTRVECIVVECRNGKGINKEKLMKCSSERGWIISTIHICSYVWRGLTEHSKNTEGNIELRCYDNYSESKDKSLCRKKVWQWPIPVVPKFWKQLKLLWDLVKATMY